MESINSTADPSITIQTDRLLLREFVIDDVDAYYELEGSQENATFQDWPPRTMEQAQNLVLSNIQSSKKTPQTVWELVVEHKGQLVGRVGAKLTLPKPNTESDSQAHNLHPHFDLWFSFLPAVRGQGFATEAMRAFIAAMVKSQGGQVELDIECDPRNTGSWKLAERLEFEKYSLTERAWESKGEWVDSLVYRKVT